MSEVVASLVGWEPVEALAAQVVAGRLGPRFPLAEFLLDLAEDGFDGVEVGTVGGQVEHVRLDGPDRLADTGHFVGRQVIHHHDVAGPQDLHQLLFDPGVEQVSCDRAVDHQGSDQTLGPEGGDERGRHPVAVRDGFAESLAGRAPAVEAGHVGFDPGFIEEHEAVGVQPDLLQGPKLRACGRDVRTVLLGRHERFF